MAYITGPARPNRARGRPVTN